MNNNLHQINDLKAEGKYFEAGKLARKLGQSDNYGCHFGFRSTLDHARAEFSRGYHTEEEATVNAVATPRYEVILRVADFNDYDCIIGWRLRRVAVTQTKAWALALRDRQPDDHDIHAEVREIGSGKRVHRDFPVTQLDYDSFDAIPF